MFALFGGFVLSAQSATEEKETDKSEYTVSSKSETVSGIIDATSPEFIRNYSNGYSADCNKLAYVSGTRYYMLYPFYTTSTENLDISSTSVSGTTDMHFTVYCDPFDDAVSGSNIIAIDDDDGPGAMPAFVPSDGYEVLANTQYYLVMSTFGSGATGAYDISFGGDFVTGIYVAPPPPPPPAAPISNWAFVLIGVLAVTVVFFKFKK